MLRRILVLLRARLAAQREGSALPLAPLILLGLVTSVICVLARGSTPPFAYALVALSVSGALTAALLLGELGALLAPDETGDWVRALPVRDIEIHIARALHLLAALALLNAGTLGPAAVLAPSSFDLALRAELVLAGLAQATWIAGVLLVAQSALRGRGQALLVALQTLLFVIGIVGAVVGLEWIPRMSAWTHFGVDEGLRKFPPAWFAAPLGEPSAPGAWRWVPWALGVASLVAVLAIPAPPIPTHRGGATLVGALLRPLRALLARIWVRGRERASYEWVFDALPREREFVLRAYPLLAVPLGFLVLGARADQASRDSLLALLLFIPGAYAPLLAAHTPGSNSHRARWLIDTAPVTRAEVDGGVLKAVVARFIVPLYVVLVALGCLQGRWETTLQLAGPALLCCVLALRTTWATFVVDTPLSTPHEQLFIDNNWIGTLAVLAIGLLVASMGATRWIDSWSASALVTAALMAVDYALDHRSRSGAQAPA